MKFSKLLYRNNTQAQNEGLGPCTVRSPYFFAKAISSVGRGRVEVL